MTDTAALEKKKRADEATVDTVETMFTLVGDGARLLAPSVSLCFALRCCALSRALCLARAHSQSLFVHALTPKLCCAVDVLGETLPGKFDAAKEYIRHNGAGIMKRTLAYEPTQTLVQICVEHCLYAVHLLQPSLDFIRWMVAAGATMDGGALTYCYGARELTVARTLVSLGADVNGKHPKYHHDVAFLAARDGNLPLLAYLVRKGAAITFDVAKVEKTRKGVKATIADTQRLVHSRKLEMQQLLRERALCGFPEGVADLVLGFIWAEVWTKD